MSKPSKPSKSSGSSNPSASGSRLVIGGADSASSQEQEAPRISFPCDDYPVKVVGAASDDYRRAVLAAAKKHDPTFDESKVSVNASRNGNYQSVRLLMRATGEAQLQALFEDLKKISGTQIVL